MRGNTAANGFNFKPVIRAVAEDITGSVTGSVHATSATGAGVAEATVEVLTAGSVLDSDQTHLVRSSVDGCEREFHYPLPASHSGW